MQAFSEDRRNYTPLLDQLALYFQIRDDLINLSSPEYMKGKSFCEDLTVRFGGVSTEQPFSPLAPTLRCPQRKVASAMAVNCVVDRAALASLRSPRRMRSLSLPSVWWPEGVSISLAATP